MKKCKETFNSTLLIQYTDFKGIENMVGGHVYNIFAGRERKIVKTDYTIVNESVKFIFNLAIDLDRTSVKYSSNSKSKKYTHSFNLMCGAFTTSIGDVDVHKYLQYSELSKDNKIIGKFIPSLNNHSLGLLLYDGEELLHEMFSVELDGKLYFRGLEILENLYVKDTSKIKDRDKYNKLMDVKSIDEYNLIALECLQ